MPHNTIYFPYFCNNKAFWRRKINVAVFGGDRKIVATKALKVKWEKIRVGENFHFYGYSKGDFECERKNILKCEKRKNKNFLSLEISFSRAFRFFNGTTCKFLTENSFCELIKNWWCIEAEKKESKFNVLTHLTERTHKMICESSWIYFF